MKLLLFLQLFLIYSTVNGQAKKNNPCKAIFKTTVDRFKKTESKALAKPLTFKAKGKTIVFDIMALGNVSMLAIIVDGGSNCIEEKSNIDFLFSNDSSSTFQNEDKFNCEGYASIRFGTVDQIAFFSKSKLTAFRIRTTKQVLDIDIPKNIAAQIQSAFSCLSKK